MRTGLGEPPTRGSPEARSPKSTDCASAHYTPRPQSLRVSKRAARSPGRVVARGATPQAELGEVTRQGRVLTKENRAALDGVGAGVQISTTPHPPETLEAI